MERSGKRSKSIKDSGGLSKKKSVDRSMNLGILMKKYRDVEDALYPFTSNMDMVFEDMDFTVEEFADIVGADVEELIEALDKAVYAR